MARLAVGITLLLAHAAHGLYEEPPGGCSAPPDDEPWPQQRQAARAKPRAAPAVPKPAPEEDRDLERELYERESAEQLAGLGGDAGDDWDEVERARLRDERMRQTLQGVAVLLCTLFALYKVVDHVRAQKENATPDTAPATAKPDASPAKAATKSAAAAPAAAAPADAPAPADTPPEPEPKAAGKRKKAAARKTED